MGLKTEDKVIITDNAPSLDMGMDDDDDNADTEESLRLASELHQACSAGQLEKSKELIEKGALAWQQDPNTGWSALHYAAGVWSCSLVLCFAGLYAHSLVVLSDNGSLELINYLLRNGAVWNLGGWCFHRSSLSQSLTRSFTFIPVDNVGFVSNLCVTH